MASPNVKYTLPMMAKKRDATLNIRVPRDLKRNLLDEWHLIKVEHPMMETNELSFTDFLIAKLLGSGR